MRHGYDGAMSNLPTSVVAFIDTAPLAHVVTLGPDGAPHVSVAWVGIEDDEIVIGTLGDQAKLRNIRADPRVAVSFQAPGTNDFGLAHYLVIRGRARVTEGGAAELLQRLAYRYIRPGVVFPGMPNPPAGFVIRITAERISGIGSWG
jgi:PPOX class probable F420-dependent enzyme